jgi:hypothetical protein
MAAQELEELLKVQRASDIELRRVLREAAIISGRLVLRQGSGVGGSIRTAQLGVTLTQLNQLVEGLWRDTERHVNKYYGLTDKAADRAAGVIYKFLAGVIPEAQAEAIFDSFIGDVHQRLEIDRTRKSIKLSERVYKNISLAQGAVEKTIRAGIISGFSAKELAAEVKRYIDPNVRGGVSHAAMRLARTEINNAYHENQKVQAAQSDYVEAVEWNLSRSHSKADTCDTYKSEGPYEPGNVPSKPHPQCFCYLSYKMMDESAALKKILQSVRAA